VRRQTEKLLMAGLDLFSRYDFSTVTIKHIARAARINSALIYYYFRNKEDLFRASIEQAILQALENYARLKDKHSDPVDLIEDWFENNVEMAVSFRKLVKIMLDYSNSQIRLASVDGLIRHFYREETSILANSVRQGVEAGVFGRVDPERAAAFASIHLDGIMAASMIRADFDLRAAIAELKAQFWHYLGYRGAARERAGRRA
jgi:AcrR family transcriptional regulator